ncbi:MAG: hypothetical protein ISS78_06440 [Phycisphaerae bacterium]|nr:hypothetical protein [Phycisphaerae bacterium]
MARHQSKLAAYTKDLELLARAKAQLARKQDDPQAAGILSEQIKQIEQRLKSFTDIPRRERQIIIVEKMQISYLTGAGDGESGRPAAAPEKTERYFRVTMAVRTPLPQNAVNNMLSALRRKCLALKSSLISDFNDVPNWAGFIAELKQAARAPRDTLRRQIWEQFGAPLKQQIISIQDGSAPTGATRRSIIKQINSLLARKDLWRKTDWDKVKLGQWEKRFQQELEKGTAKTPEIVHLNRAGLQTAFPKQMPRWDAKELRSVGFHELNFRYLAPTGSGVRGTTAMPDPTFKGEDMADDTRLDITVILSVADDGLDLSDDEAVMARP